MTKKYGALYENGIIPHIQIHDEVDISIESDKQAEDIIEIMESAVELKVPNKVDYESGEARYKVMATYLNADIPPFIVKYERSICMTLNNIKAKVLTVLSSVSHRYQGWRSYLTSCLQTARVIGDCLSARFSKNRMTEPKCPICRLTSWNCGTVLVIIPVFIILVISLTNVVSS